MEEPRAAKVPQRDPDEDAVEDAGLLRPVVVLSLVLVGAWGATGVTGGLLRGVGGLVVMLTGGYLAYLVVIFGGYAVVVRLIDRSATQRPEGVLDRFPLVFVLVGGALLLSWTLTAWLSGYDAAQWGWSGGSVLAAVAIVGLVTVRRRRGGEGPDGPDGPDGPEQPRHRRSGDFS